MPLFPVSQTKWNVVTTMGYAFLGALPMVTHFFVLRIIIMRKKVTNEDVANAIQKMALELRNEIYCDLNDVEYNMQEVEKKLVKTFTEEQLEIYREFCQKRKEFYNLASQAQSGIRGKTRGEVPCVILRAKTFYRHSCF